MDFTLLQQWWTVLAFVFFVGVVIWALMPKRKAEFEEAANLPLEDDDVATKTTNTAQTRAENSNG